MVTEVTSSTGVVRMPTGFAGSKSLDERRRRRLAQESVDQAVSVTSTEGSKAPTGTESTPSQMRQFRRGANESLIPQKPWKITLLASVIVLSWGAMLWAGNSFLACVSWLTGCFQSSGRQSLSSL